jgi:Fe-S oxidoreductase/nitrate reductase gamma subunit
MGLHRGSGSSLRAGARWSVKGGAPVTTPTREILWNIHGAWLIYLFLVPALAVMAYGFWRRLRLWRLGQPSARLDQIGERLKLVLKHAVFQQRLAKNRLVGFFHITFSWGFVLLFIGTVIVLIQQDFRIPIMHGPLYLYFQSLVLDLAGALSIVALAIGWIRREVTKPRALKAGKNHPSILDDWIFNAHYILIMWSGFVLEGIRIYVTKDPWGSWSPVGLIHGQILGPLMSESALRLTHQIVWWGHYALTLTFMIYLPFSKMIHIFTGPLNIFFQDLGPRGTFAPVDLETETPKLGYASLWDFSWKDLADLDACTECGRCQEACPAYLTGKPLNPKALILDLQHHLHEQGPLMTLMKLKGEVPLEQPFESTLVGPVIDPEALWACTTCRACMDACPVNIEHVPKIVEMRRHQVMLQGEFPSELNQTFKNLERQGNPWGLGAHTRGNWAEELGVPTVAENPEAEYLFWPGCTGAFDQRGQKIVKAIVQLLNIAGISFAILGKEEKCTGELARRVGNEMIFQQLATENIETLKAHGVKKIITHCPHCANTFMNDYKQMGFEVEVIHHTQILATLVRDGKLRPTTPIEETVTYHDSCYLGRYNQIYTPPRELLGAIPGLKLQEMERHAETGMCCGAGGGRMWLEEHHGKRVNVERTEQAKATGATTVATNCPFCMTMISDGAAALATEPEDQLRVLDLAEMLLLSVEGAHVVAAITSEPTGN